MSQQSLPSHVLSPTPWIWGPRHCSNQQNTAEGMLIQPPGMSLPWLPLLPALRNTYSWSAPSGAKMPGWEAWAMWRGYPEKCQTAAWLNSQLAVNIHGSQTIEVPGCPTQPALQMTRGQSNIWLYPMGDPQRDHPDGPRTPKNHERDYEIVSGHWVSGPFSSPAIVIRNIDPA